MSIELHLGDCIDVMRGMDDNSVDAIVTDPPYGLKFMGKTWDYDVPRVEVWQECLRVLKPGGHLLSFAGTRTQHRMCCNVEDAGFEIRDMIAWIYGSGFPKSLNISKAIDKAAGAEREVVGTNPNFCENRKDSIGTDNGIYGGAGPDKGRNITASATPAAKQWDGWGTALKPALEPITLARKPISEKTIAANVLKWGTGGINVDGCRINTITEKDKRNYTSNRQCKYKGGWLDNMKTENGTTPHSQGRFPANLCHDGSDEVVAMFPETGNSASRNAPKGGTNFGVGNSDKKANADSNYSNHGDSGSAARFFYCAKASKRDRNEGLEDTEPIRRADRIKDDGVGRDNPRNRTNKPRQNHHPTVKPTPLMQYLCRLITPPDGIVLDPFMGSGSTGKACAKEGFDFIGIEYWPEYLEIARRRIESVKKEFALFGE